MFCIAGPISVLSIQSFSSLLNIPGVLAHRHGLSVSIIGDRSSDHGLPVSVIDGTKSKESPLVVGKYFNQVHLLHSSFTIIFSMNVATGKNVGPPVDLNGIFTLEKIEFPLLFLVQQLFSQRMSRLQLYLWSYSIQRRMRNQPTVQK